MMRPATSVDLPASVLPVSVLPTEWAPGDAGCLAVLLAGVGAVVSAGAGSAVRDAIVIVFGVVLPFAAVLGVAGSGAAASAGAEETGGAPPDLNCDAGDASSVVPSRCTRKVLTFLGSGNGLEACGRGCAPSAASGAFGNCARSTGCSSLDTTLTGPAAGLPFLLRSAAS